MPQMFDLGGKRALVTGGGTGLGRAMAHALAEAGAAVALAARRREKLEGCAEEIRALGGTARAVSCDLTRPESIRDAAREVEDALGGVDILAASLADDDAGARRADRRLRGGCRSG